MSTTPEAFMAALNALAAQAEAVHLACLASHAGKAWLFGRRESMGGGARGYVMCRACLYAQDGKLLVHRRALGRHLRMHARARAAA